MQQALLDHQIEMRWPAIAVRLTKCRIAASRACARRSTLGRRHAEHVRDVCRGKLAHRMTIAEHIGAMVFR